MRQLLLILLAVPVISYPSPGIIRLSLYDPVVHELICDKGVNSTIKALVSHGKCVYRRIDSAYDALLEKCWHDTTGIEFPSSRQEWVKFYCNNTHPWILKNLAEHCFISRYKKKVELDDFNYITDRCISFELDDEDREGVGAEHVSDEDEEEYYERDCKTQTITEENDKNDCALRLAHENRIKKICVENDTKLIQEEIHQHKCIERAAPTELDIVKFCWNVVIKKPYPRNDAGWKELSL